MASPNLLSSPWPLYDSLLQTKTLLATPMSKLYGYEYNVSKIIAGAVGNVVIP